MNRYEWLHTLLLFALLLAALKPLGRYLVRVYQGERTPLSPLLGPCETLIYRLCGVEREEEMDWRRYAWAMLLSNLTLGAALFLLLRGQHFLPGNPERLPGFPWQLALHTAVSFVTNTNYQNYSGEAALGYLTQMVGLTVHNFVSAATGMAVAMALIRGFARRKATGIGNFWVDLTRGLLYILLPLSLVAALALVSQGVIQNFSPYRVVSLVEPRLDPQGPAVVEARLPMGPVASQEAIKLLGTNGGGFFAANSAHPFENPTPLSNFLETLLILLIPGAFTVAFGVMVGNPRQGLTLLFVMLFLLLTAFAVLQGAESHGNPGLARLGAAGPNLEGKELRFGLAGSNLFTVVTTATSCGAVTAMHDSLTPLGGLVPLALILLGEMVFGGVGSGLYTMLAFAIVAVFVSGLMIGRTPEYLGKKIEVREMWLAILIILSAGLVVLVLSGLAVLTPAARAATANPGSHGLTEVLYAMASMANNNGSAMAGLATDGAFYNLLGTLAMLIGRYVPAVSGLALAGTLAGKRYVPPSLGTLPTDQAPFAIWLTVVIVIVGALSFFPALALGPIVEQLTMLEVGGN